MRKSFKQRLLAIVLAATTMLGLGIPAQASSIQDGSKTVTVDYDFRYEYLTTTAGTTIRAGGNTYTTNDNLTGPAYCINHGLDWSEKVLPITGKYNSSPQTAGAFANGYPQHDLETFLGLYLEDNAILEGLTMEEYCYATQVAVWATLGQVAVDGTEFTKGQEYIQAQSTTQGNRVFRAVQLICDVASTWKQVYQTGMYITRSGNAWDGDLHIPKSMTLDAANKTNQYGVMREVINGVP